MSNKHVNHQHGLSTMNALRPKSKMFKRRNKAKAKARKAPLLEALRVAIASKKTTKKEARAAKAAATATKPAVAKAKEPKAEVAA